ncbi:2-aminoadipate transaminase [Episyrphus balteatus]|uniref:2-aminoadipate transaminase n=1 Tax=Episyrphus balteatus TaxID=286459 RepID=UPI0024862D92|nr:2-aminoadipate transaminase [Episyrphus balteatus]
MITNKFSAIQRRVLSTTFICRVNKQFFKSINMDQNYPKKNEDRMLKHLFDGSDWNVYDKNITNLGVGAPGPDILVKCCDIFEKATSHRMKLETTNQGMLFQYGPTVGVIEVRSGIAKFLTDAYKSEVKSEDIIVTTGATQGLHIILSTLIDLNGYIFVDEVTYMIALDVFRQFSTLKIVPVKLNSDGVGIKALRAFLEQKQFKSETKSFWGLYYAIPTYHNPTGITFSKDVLKNLITLAREFDILIACDDVYNTLYYGENVAQKRLYAYDDPNDDDFKGNVISNGSFSKIIGPGLRFGWLEVPPRCKSILETCGLLNSGGCLNNYTSGIMASLLDLGLGQAHAKMVKELYEERMLATCDILRNNLPKSCQFIEPQGGYFVWIQMPEDTDANAFLQICIKRHKLFFIPGNRFSLDNNFKNCFRISIAFHQKEVIQSSVRRICNALKEYLNL